MDKNKFLLLAELILLLLITRYCSGQYSCGGGQFISNNTDGNPFCVNCPADTYKPDTSEFDEATECLSCPEDRPRNLVTGSSTLDECRYAACRQGQMYNSDDILQCLTCPIGTFQDKTYPLEFDTCSPCSPGRSTASSGSTSADCVAPCPSGQEFSAQRQQCVECRVNYYKDVSMSPRGEYTSCVQCPDPGFRTGSTGATSVEECNVVTCEEGTYTDLEENRCVTCGPDTFQNQIWQTSCVACPRNHGTHIGIQGADDISFCHDFCPSGQERNNITGACQACPIGYYKDNTLDRFTPCIICPDPEFVTMDTSSTRLSDCNIANCSAGSYRDTETNTCLPCEKGTYQERNFQIRCHRCPRDKTTLEIGSTSIEQCIDSFVVNILVNLKTIFICSQNPDLTNSSSAAYQSLSARSFTIVNNLIKQNLEDVRITFVGFRCFNDTINILVNAEITSCYSDNNFVKTTVQELLTSDMEDGQLDDPEETAAPINVNINGVTDTDIAVGEGVPCPPGHFTNLLNVTCLKCDKGTFQPEGAPELCVQCPRGWTTAGQGAVGNITICRITDAEDYIEHVFMLDILTTMNCTHQFLDYTTAVYRNLSQASPLAVRNILTQNLDSTLRLNTPIVSFIGFRCFGRIGILVEITLTNVEEDINSVINSAVIEILRETENGTLRNPIDSASTPIPVVGNRGSVSNILARGNLHCPNGQFTNAMEERCEPCPLRTFQPENVPELCFPCQPGTTTNTTGTILPISTRDQSVVCIGSATDPPPTFTLPQIIVGCQAFLWNSLCVSLCPTGWSADDQRVCIKDPVPTIEVRRRTVTKLGMTITLVLGSVFIVLLGIFVFLLCWDYSAYKDRKFVTAKRESFLDKAPQKLNWKRANQQRFFFI